MKQVRVLLTGYGPFLTNPVNPTQLIAEHMDKLVISVEQIEICITEMVLSVDEHGARTVSDLIQSNPANFPYDMIIHMGLSASSTQVCFELCASNYSVKEKRAIRGGPAILGTTVASTNQLSTYIWQNNDQIDYSRDPVCIQCISTLGAILLQRAILHHVMVHHPEQAADSLCLPTFPADARCSAFCQHCARSRHNYCARLRERV